MRLKIPDDAIPPNFDLQVYESARKLNLAGWYENLYQRVWIQTLLRLNGHEDQFPRKNRELLLFNLLTQPIITSPELESKSDNLFKASSRVVHPVTLKDVMDITADIQNGFWGEDIREMADIFNTPRAELCGEAEDALNKQPVEIHNNPLQPDEIDPVVWVTVDLNSKDQEIKESFSMWLSNVRRKFPDNKQSTKRQRKNKTVSSLKLKSWCDNKILAYLDLTLWNEYRGNTLTDEMMGALIFPELGESVKAKNSISCKGKISDSVKPIVREVTSEKTMTRIRNLILSGSGAT